MITIDFNELQTAFDAAANLESEERQKYLEKLASYDRELANEVSTLLGFDTKSDDPLDAACSARRSDETVGEAAVPLPTFPGYILRRRVGSGGQADVYLARQESTGQDVAIKIFRGGNLAESLRNRIEAEANALVRLQLPNVVAILDRGQTACGRDYLVTRFIAGLPIDLAASKLLGRDVQKFFQLFAKVADTLGRVHRQGIVHRDLKPSNILVDQDGEPYVLDFGLASVSPGPLCRLHTATPTGAFVGSILWASPEQVDGSIGAIDERSDIYSLGVVMYQALTGRFPYPVEGAIHEVARRIVEIAPAPIVGPSLASGLNVARDVEAILFRALEKQPGRRFQSSDEFAAALHKLRHGAASVGNSARNGRSRLRRIAALIAVAALIAAAWPVLIGLVAAIPAEQVAKSQAAPAELAETFDDELAPFGVVPAGWSQVGPLETNLYQIERSNISVTGDFVSALGVSVDRAARAGFEMTLVGADGGSDLTITAQKMATWSDNESWEIRTPAGSVLRGLPVGVHSLTLKRQGELLTLSADAVHSPGQSNSVVATFAAPDAKRFKAIRLSTSSAAIHLHRLRLHVEKRNP